MRAQHAAGILMISRTFDRLVITVIGCAVIATVAASLTNQVRSPAKVPRVAFDIDLSEKAVRETTPPAPIPASALSMAAAAPIEAPAPAPVPEPVAEDPEAVRLAEKFDQLGYDLDRIREDGAPVPRIFLAKLPDDLHMVPEVSLKKTVFFRTMLPLVLQENERILADRQRLRRLRAEVGIGAVLAPRDRLWLAVLAERYKVRDDDFDELLRRVDIVPPSLAMAQAAEESGWGTSRFAQVGNALFGQWTTSHGTGLVPLDRPEDAAHKVKSFSTLTQSVASYMRNLNTHRAYRGFREMRAGFRMGGAPLDGYTLAETLISYSERGEAYTESVRVIINANGLRALDGARLKADPVRKPAA